jgi:hypothetical protein
MEANKILIYQTTDGHTQIETQIQDGTVWLSIEQMATLFQKAKSTINEHILNVYAELELEEAITKKKIGISDLSTKPTNFYNLDVIISVGYRVKSLQGTKFRQWATARLTEYIVKGFTINDDYLKQSGNSNYFEELLARIRDIRSSEKIFWRKILDIYATSIDYDGNSSTTKLFFKTVQNKMHWVAHKQTAAEVIFNRIDATKPNIGLTTFKGIKPTKQETEIAKNYLTEAELNVLNRMVTAYLEVAEIQALNQIPMYMKDWQNRLGQFIQMTGNEILEHPGSVSHEQAIAKAHAEYEKYNLRIINDTSDVEKTFIRNLETKTKKIEKKQ